MKGEFNVPFGNSGRVICHKGDVLKFGEALRPAKIVRSDFQSVIELAGEGDVVYCDPPYTCKNLNEVFVRYNERLFSWHDQERLAECLRQASARGAYIAVSNAWHPETLSLYGGWFVAQVGRQSAIARKIAGRGPTVESIICSKPAKDWETFFGDALLCKIPHGRKRLLSLFDRFSAGVQEGKGRGECS